MRHCCTISQTMLCDGCDVRTATRSSWCGMLFEYVLRFVCMLFVSGASEPFTCIEHRRSWTLRAIHSVLKVRSILLRFCQRFARVFLHTSLFAARTYNISWQCPNLEHKCLGIFCLVACERPVVPPCGSKFVFQRVTARFCCCSSSLRWNVPTFAVSVRFRHLFRGRVLCAVSAIL